MVPTPRPSDRDAYLLDHGAVHKDLGGAAARRARPLVQRRRTAERVTGQRKLVAVPLGELWAPLLEKVEA